MRSCREPACGCAVRVLDISRWVVLLRWRGGGLVGGKRDSDEVASAFLACKLPLCALSVCVWVLADVCRSATTNKWHDDENN